MAKPRTPVETRIWKYVIKTDTCWVWHLPMTRRTSYPTIFDNGVSRKASWVTWELANGDIPTGMWVLHKCDNKVCVRPDHLYLGTREDNARDIRERGNVRNRTFSGTPKRGDDHWSRLHPEWVPRGERHYRRLHPEKVVRGDAHYYRKDPSRIRRGEQTGRTAKLREQDVRAIWDRLLNGDRPSRIAADFDVSRATITHISQGKSWSHLVPAALQKAT